MAANFLNLRDFLLPVCNFVRQLPTDFGVRLYTITVRVTEWTNQGPFNMPGSGTKTVTQTPLVLDGYGTLPLVTALTDRDISASNGLYKDGDYKVDYITPAYNNIYGSGGVAFNLFDPATIPETVEIEFVLTGPEFPQGALFKKIKTFTYQPFHYTLILRKIGVNA